MATARLRPRGHVTFDVYMEGEGSATLVWDVTGVDSDGGVDCSASEMEVDGEIVHESCINPELGLTPYTAYYEDGETAVSMELTAFSTN